MLSIKTGDDVAIFVQCKLDGATFVIDPGATVEAVISYGGSPVSTVITCLDSDTGADWPNSLVVVEMTAAQTATLPVGKLCALEVRVDDSGKTTFCVEPIDIRRGVLNAI